VALTAGNGHENKKTLPRLAGFFFKGMKLVAVLKQSAADG